MGRDTALLSGELEAACGVASVEPEHGVELIGPMGVSVACHPKRVE
jgi:hypothetical protein